MTYFVDSVVCDYGVFAGYFDKSGESHNDLKIICNRRDNALLIAEIMNKDDKGEYGGIVKKGKWITKVDYGNHRHCYCPFCRNKGLDVTQKYCYECGAKMEGAEE